MREELLEFMKLALFVLHCDRKVKCGGILKALQYMVAMVYD